MASAKTPNLSNMMTALWTAVLWKWDHGRWWKSGSILGRSAKPSLLGQKDPIGNLITWRWLPINRINVELMVGSSCRDKDVHVNHVLVHCECLVGLSQ
jgi:hypothetical protein